MTIPLELEKFLKGGNLLVSIPLEKYENTLIEFLKFLTNEKGLKGILLTVNKPFRSFISILEKNKINMDNLIVIDCISSTEEKREGNCLYLRRPFSPTTASIRIGELTKDPEIKFVIFDTLTSLLAYDGMTITKFFQHILSYLLMEHKLTIVLGIDIDIKAIEIKLIAQYCNKTIKI